MFLSTDHPFVLPCYSFYPYILSFSRNLHLKMVDFGHYKLSLGHDNL